MFATLEGQPSDYAPEGVVSEFEVTAPNIIDLQEFTDEDSTEFVCESLTMAIADLKRLVGVRTALGGLKQKVTVFAKEDASTKTTGCRTLFASSTLHTLASVRATHQDLERRYGDVAVMATESLLEGSSTIIAIEEEEQKERGFFRKIWDKICAAFSWLWKKISGLFATGANPDKANEKSKDDLEAMKKLIADGVDIQKAEFELLGVKNAFGHLGNPIAMHAVAEHLKQMVSHLRVLESLATALETTFVDMVTTVSKSNLTTEELVACNVSASAKIKAALGGFAKGQASDLEFNKDLAAFASNGTGAEIFILKNFCKNRTFAIVGAAAPGGDQANLMFKAGFGGPSVDNRAVECPMPSITDLEMIQGESFGVRKQFKTTAEHCEKLSKTSEGHVSKLAAAGNAVAGEDSELRSKTVELLKLRGDSLTQIQMSIVAAIMAANESATSVGEFITRYVEAARKVK